MQSLLILGRQPKLGLAELESLYGAEKLKPLNDNGAVIVDVDPCLLAFDRLGGSLKFAKLLTVLDTVDWSEIMRFLVDAAPKQAETMPPGKMQLGLSLYGFSLKPQDIIASGHKLKQAIQATGRKVRFIPNKAAELNTAQVLHNKLTGPNGWELLFLRDGQRTFIAQSVKVQNITAYTKRDRMRPRRDVQIGMLPPKLAQIIINLSVGLLPPDKLKSICDIPAGQAVPPPKLDQTILDPFCGTGVTLMEAKLMGYAVYGSDINERMVEFSRHNLEWLSHNFKVNNEPDHLEIADATQHHWSSDFDFVACETYLGPAYSVTPLESELNKTINECNEILKQTLINLSSQQKKVSRCCLAVPAWQIKPGKFKRLPLIDQIEETGYNLVTFKHSKRADLIYYRANQVVARELIVIASKQE